MSYFPPLPQPKIVDQKGKLETPWLAWFSALQLFVTSTSTGGGFANPMTTLGDIITATDGGTAERLGIGTSGQILTVSTSGVPEWDDASGGGFANPMTTLGDVIIATDGGTAERLGIGTSGQVFTVSTSGSPAWEDATGFVNPMTTKADVIVADTGGTPERLGVGTDGQVVTADSTAPYGVDYKAPTDASVGTYGDANDVPVIVVAASGRITGITTIPIGPISGAGAYDAAVLADTPIHYWKCNETTGTTLADTIAGAYNFPLTLQGSGNTLAFQQLLYGSYGLLSARALTYTTQNGAQGSGLPTDITVPMTYSYTCEFILNSLDLYLTAGQVYPFGVTSDASGSANDNIQLAPYLLNSGSSWTINMTWMYATGTGFTISGPILNVNNHHIVIQKDSVAGTVAFFVDGLFRNSQAYAHDCTGGSASNININRNRAVSGISLPYENCISRVAFYNKVLSADRIATHALYGGYYPGA